MQPIDFNTQIATLDSQINDAKAYLKKLRQYKRTLQRIQTAQAEIEALEQPPQPPEPTTAPVPTPADNAQEQPAAPQLTLVPDLPAAPCAGLLPEVSSAPRLVIITPAPAIDVPAEVIPDTTPDYSTLGIRRLRKLCSQRNIPGASRLNKAQALAALTALDLPAAA